METQLLDPEAQKPPLVTEQMGVFVRGETICTRYAYILPPRALCQVLLLDRAVQLIQKLTKKGLKMSTYMEATAYEQFAHSPAIESRTALAELEFETGDFPVTAQPRVADVIGRRFAAIESVATLTL